MKYGTISTGSKEASIAASEILKYGGNAFDAAIAAIFVSMTSEYCLTGACGGGIMLAYPNNSSPIIFDFFIHTPKNYTYAKFIKNPSENDAETMPMPKHKYMLKISLN